VPRWLAFDETTSRAIPDGAAAMKGRIWLAVGIAVGVAVGVGRIVYFNGAATSLSDTALRVVGTAGLSIVHGAATRGASRRVVEGFAAVIAVLVPGVTALLLILAARATLRLRALISIAVVALGIAAFFYEPAGIAGGAAALAIAAAGIAIVATGPFVAAPLAALAALIGTAYLPRLVAHDSTVPNAAVAELHEAIFASAGSPIWLRIVVLVLAALPFVAAARLVVR
jgi:hypothetical protein